MYAIHGRPLIFISILIKQALRGYFPKKLHGFLKQMTNKKTIFYNLKICDFIINLYVLHSLLIYTILYNMIKKVKTLKSFIIIIFFQILLLLLHLPPFQNIIIISLLLILLNRYMCHHNNFNLTYP